MINSWVQTIYIKNTGSCKVVVSDGKQDQGQLIMNTLNNLTVNFLSPMIWLSILPLAAAYFLVNTLQELGVRLKITSST